MITGWRQDRRIGRPSLVEMLSSQVKMPLIITAANALGSLFLLFIRMAFGNHYSHSGMVRVWCVTFVILMAAPAIAALFSRRWEVAGLLVIFGTALTCFAWSLAIPVLIAAGVVPEPVMIYPVNP